MGEWGRLRIRKLGPAQGTMRGELGCGGGREHRGQGLLRSKHKVPSVTSVLSVDPHLTLGKW